MPTAAEWIAAFARQLDIEPLDDSTIKQLLDLAGIAAHDSQRVAAPLACYMIGLAGVAPGAALEMAQRTRSLIQNDEG